MADMAALATDNEDGGNAHAERCSPCRSWYLYMSTRTVSDDQPIDLGRRLASTQRRNSGKRSPIEAWPR